VSVAIDDPELADGITLLGKKRVGLVCPVIQALKEATSDRS
jgi:hypothetical protein